MPFTPSHVAAVLPAFGRGSARVVPVAWVVGSMVPDLPYFVSRGAGSGLTHSPVGIVTVDLVVGMLVVLLWWDVLLRPVRDLLPPALGQRLPLPAARPRPAWRWVAVGIVGGALTHVLWDSFTHAGRWGTRWVPLLHSQVGVLPGYKWAQYGSGVVGGTLVLLALVRAARSAVPSACAPAKVTPEVRLAAAAGIVVLVAVVGLAVGLARRGQGLEVVLFGLVTRGGAAAGAGVLLVCLGWWLLPPRSAVVRPPR